MPEATNSILYNAGSLGVATHQSDMVANVAGGGAQYGFGNHLHLLDTATPLVLPRLIGIVTHVPTMMQHHGEMGRVLKNVIERCATSIEGVDFEVTAEMQNAPAGQDGQSIKMHTGTKRSEVNPQFTIPEVYGNLIWNLFHKWIVMSKDPDTQGATSSALGEAYSRDPQLLSSITMNMLFIQHDTTFRWDKIIDGFFVTAMMPTSTGMIGWKNAITESVMPSRTIPMTGILQHNANTKKVARDVSEVLQLHTVDYWYSTPVAERVHSALNNIGIQEEITRSLNEYRDMSMG